MKKLCVLICLFFLALLSQGQTIRGILFNPPGTDDGIEYVEIAHTASTTLTGLTLLEIDGDGTSSGNINTALSLNVLSTGTNGLLLIRDAMTVLSPPPSAATTTVVVNFTPDLQNGTGTFMIVSGFSGAVGNDLDPENDGTFNTTPWTTVFHAVSVTDGTAGDGQYADDVGGTNLPDIASFAPEGFVNYNSTLYAIDIGGTSPGPFPVDAAWDASGTRSGVLEASTLTPGGTNGPLPVKFSNVKAWQQGTGIRVEWSNLTEIDVLDYKVERSGDARSFAPLSTQTALKNDGGRADYSFFDALPVNGVNFYRIQSQEGNGQKLYSVIVRVDTRGGKMDIGIYPNPVSNGQLSLQAVDLPNGLYTLRIFNTGGQQVHTQQLNMNGGSVSEMIQLPASMKAGIYHLQLSNAELKFGKRFLLQ